MEYLNKSCDFIIAYDEVDFLGRLKPSAFLQYFQDAVEIHARDLNITHDQMAEKGKFWVLSRIITDIDFYPSVGTRIFLSTYPHKPGIVEAYRSFYLSDAQGRVFARSTSKWGVLDMQTKRICRCRDLFDYPDEAFNPLKAVEFPARSFKNKFDKEKSQKIKDFCVNITDLDENLHMNNARYGDIILNICDFDELKQNEIEAFDISFLSELKYGDIYSVFLNRQDGFSEIDGFMGERQVFSTRFKWRNKFINK